MCSQECDETCWEIKTWGRDFSWRNHKKSSKSCVGVFQVVLLANKLSIKNQEGSNKRKGFEINRFLTIYFPYKKSQHSPKHSDPVYVSKNLSCMFDENLPFIDYAPALFTAMCQENDLVKYISKDLRRVLWFRM